MSTSILAIDTATEACSVALLHEGQRYSVFEICPQQHSKKVLHFVEQVLTQAAIKVADINAIAYGCGPGSFTGVRIAASTVQGLAYAHDIAVIPISTMAAMAYENFKSYGQSQSLALIDARMSEVYTAEYHCSVEHGAILQDDEQVLAPDLLQDKVARCDWSQIVGTGLQSYWQALSLKNLPSAPKVLYPNAAFMLDIALGRLAKGEVQTAQDISPTYVRDTVTWQKLPGK